MATEFIWPLRVYYEDTDHSGVVYYANYLKFMERARTEWLRELGYEQDTLAKREGLLFAVRDVQLSYRQPARFNDELEVTATVEKVGRASIDFLQQVRRSESLLCEGRIRLAALDAENFRPKPMSSALLQSLANNSG